MCWGIWRQWATLGNDGIADKDYPVHVVAREGSTDHLSGIVQIAVGFVHTCALNSDGGVLCWGNGGNGRLGNDGTASKHFPVHVVDGDGSANHLSGIVQISAGSTHTCALHSNAEMSCAGERD